MAHYDKTIEKMKDVMRNHEGQFLQNLSNNLFENDLLKDSVYEGKDKSADTAMQYLCNMSDVPVKTTTKKTRRKTEKHSVSICAVKVKIKTKRAVKRSQILPVKIFL